MQIFDYLSKCIESLIGDAEELIKAPSRKDRWNQTVAFLAQHGEKKYQGIHQANKDREKYEQAASAHKRGDEAGPKTHPTKVPAGPSRRGSENEVARVKGEITKKRVSFPLAHSPGEMGFRHINVQHVHHFKWSGDKWHHTHTTEEGAGLNSKS